MSSAAAALNAFAPSCLQTFAWPMLWQSSLLAAVLLVIDRLLQRRSRPAVRYALWLVLLIKLLLPPSLALPTGAAWWLRSPVTPVPRPPTSAVVVTYGPAAGSSAVTPVTANAATPAMGLRLSVWLLLTWGCVALALFGWMLVRWRVVSRLTREADPAPRWLQALLVEARARIGLRRRVDIKVIGSGISPAVCGFFRPIILLSQPLVSRLPTEQLQAIVLHELLHVGRYDVWLNCLQSLLQVVYWWHPFLWFANSRIRRLREEAVDDAVILALDDQAETYAPTLLQVARLALSRPLTSLGLIGIFESKTALHRRIRRLVDIPGPRRAGSTVAAGAAIFAFALAALPMGSSPRNTPPGFSQELARSDSITANVGQRDLEAGNQREAPQIHIRTKFYTVPATGASSLGNWAPVSTNAQPADSGATVLAPAQAAVLARALEMNPGSSLVSEASVTTLSGRRAELQVVDLKTVVTGIDPKALTPPGVPGEAVPYLTTNMALGPVVDLLPRLLTNGTELELSVQASVVEFLGYDKPANEVPVYVGGRKASATPPLPHVRVRRISREAITVPDGYSLVLGNPTGLGDRTNVVVVITPRLIDPSGKPIHEPIK